ncbi:alpha/beta hydrolase [Hydrogenophaga sp.]|uniref:alpha/beta fold hydrolase n=1 Tax=Hydrogenophaga sp. TaxID=1904254 RepID=UPI00286D70A2|nr:alpha/beta hydrolase [Hydrogenophaga sp.]
MYQARRPSRSTFVTVRDLRYHVRTWGDPVPGQAPLVLVHGWMDVGASWQFMVDALEQERWVIAPDWRGYGLTQSPQPRPDSYWFADYLGDLDALLDHFSPGQPVDLVGHSMGGNVAMMYAGVRPARIRRLVNLEGFGLPATRPAQAPTRLAQWLDEIRALRRGEMDLKTYDSADGVARRLMKTNPRLGADKAAWLAQHWAAPDAQGRWAVLGEAAHKVVNPQLYRVDEALAIYARIAAPVLSVTASDDSLGQWWKGKFTLTEYRERLRHVPQLTEAHIDDAGHMLQHDQPERLAALIEDFLG